MERPGNLNPLHVRGYHGPWSAACSRSPRSWIFGSEGPIQYTGGSWRTRLAMARRWDGEEFHDVRGSTSADFMMVTSMVNSMHQLSLDHVFGPPSSLCEELTVTGSSSKVLPIRLLRSLFWSPAIVRTFSSSHVSVPQGPAGSHIEQRQLSAFF